MTKILVVDDEPDLLELLEISIRRFGLEVVVVKSVLEASNSLAQDAFGLVVTDMRLPDGTGIEVVREVKDRYPGTPIAVLTAHATAEGAVEAFKAGAFDYVAKPISLPKLRELVQGSLKASVDEPSKNDREQAPSASSIAPLLLKFVGQSEVGITHFNEALSFVNCASPVVLVGEKGSGRVHAAKMMHNNSLRSKYEVLVLDYNTVGRSQPGHTALHDALLESKGDMDDADWQCTLILKNVHLMSMAEQHELLSIVTPHKKNLSGKKEINWVVKLYVIADTPLDEYLAAGTLRADLFYTINIVVIKVPPLRERLSDLPLLINHFLKDLSLKNPPLKVSSNVILELERYRFPGNIGELKALIERSALACVDDVINCITWPKADQVAGPAIDVDNPALPEKNGSSGSPGSHWPWVAELPSDLLGALDMLQSATMLLALDKARNNQTLAAQSLGMSFRKFRYEMSRLDLNRRKPSKA